MDHGFIGRHLEMQVLLVDPTAGTPIGAERRSCPFTGVAVDLAAAVPVIIPGPFVDAVADRGMGGVTPSVALPRIGRQLRAANRKVFHHALMTSPSVRVVAPPKTLLARVAGDDADAGRTLMGRGAVPLALIRAPAGRSRGVARGCACFPRHSGRVHPPQRPCRPARRSARWCSGGLGCAVARYAAGCATPPTRARGGPSAHLWPSHAAGAPAWPVVAASVRRRSLSTACSTHRTPDSGRPGTILVRGTGAAWCWRSGGL